MRFTHLLEEWAMKIFDMYLIRSIRRGLMYTMPLILIGSFILMFINLPIPEFQEWMSIVLSPDWKTGWLYVYRGTFEIISIVVFISISYSMIVENDLLKKDMISPIIPILVLLGAYFASISTENEIIQMREAAATGLFRAIVSAIILTYIFLFVYRHRLLKYNVLTFDSDLVLTQTFKCLEPAIWIFLFVAIFKLAVTRIGISEALTEQLAQVTDYFSKDGNDITAGFFYNIILHGLWFMGLHGSNILEGFVQAVFATASTSNMQLFQTGALPTEILTKEFFDCFVFIGGSGASLCLIIALLIKGNKNNTGRLAKISLLQGVFNINEMVIYGLPVVMNIFYLIPFILTPIVLMFTSYIALRLGLVPLTVSAVTWTTPIILGGYVATNSISGAILQVVNLCIGISIYMPFVVRYEQHNINKNKSIVKKLVSAVLNYQSAHEQKIMDTSGEIGFLSRSLIQDMYSAIERNKNPMHMEFQPKVHKDGNVIGVEALLRWNHEKYGRIPPPVIVFLADEAGLTDDLGNWIINESLRCFSQWQKSGIHDIVMSINLSAQQMKNPALIQAIRQAFALTGINPQVVEFELTEGTAFERSEQTKQFLEELRGLGVRLAIDDFGMGHSSLHYIKEFQIDTLKLDGSLVKDVVQDVSSQEIINSIMRLCNQLKISVVAEVVETENQREALEKLGCDIYQGYLYSPSLMSENAVRFIKEFNRANGKKGIGKLM